MTKAFFQFFFLFGHVWFIKGQNYPPTLSYTIRLRDQSFFSREFESYNSPCGDATSTNMMEPSLYGSAQDMIFIPPPLRSSTQVCTNCFSGLCKNVTVNNYGALFFDNFFHDSPGLNVALDSQLIFNLVNETQGLYSFNYTTPWFYPLNDYGFSREQIDTDSQTTWTPGTPKANYGFSTELRIPFYYRGGEVFQFSGDDDIWVYVDNQLQCDMGGLHAKEFCFISLDSLGFQKNTTHTLTVFQCERHSYGSNYFVTTSILPLDQPPQISNLSLSLYEDTNITVSLVNSVFHPNSQNLFYSIVSPAPINGILLNASTLTPISIPSSSFNILQPFIYVPYKDVYGNDTIYFIANDGQLNSTTGSISIFIAQVHDPPQFPLIGNYSINTGDSLVINITASDRDSPQSALSYTITSHLQYGNGYINQTLGNGTLFYYNAVLPGIEYVQLHVFNGFVFQSTSFYIFINETYSPYQGNNSSNQTNNVPNVVTGNGLSFIGLICIIAAGVFLFLFIGILLIVCCYKFCASRRLEIQWEEEFTIKSVYNNPLYKSMDLSSNPILADTTT